MENKIPLIILYIILTGLFISSLLYLIFIKEDTSKNPLILEEESDKSNYFKNLSYIDYPDKAFCKCGDDILLDYCNEDLLKSGCQNFYESKKLQNFNNDECEVIQNKIMIHNTKLINIFNLETSAINSSIFSLLTFNIVIFVLILLIYPLYVLFSCPCIKSDDCCCCLCGCAFKLCNMFCANSIVFCLFFVILILLIVDIVTFSSGCKYYKNDDTNKFLDFLQCSNVNKEGFQKFCAIEDLSSHFNVLIILQSIFIVSIFASGVYMIIDQIHRLNNGSIKKEDDDL